MGRLFGTDGVRGLANCELSATLCMKLAWAFAELLKQQGCEKPQILIGRDTRISGDMLQSALCAGFLSAGADAFLLEVIPTPAVAYLVSKKNFDGAVMISASHNSYEYNGVKFFGPDGNKLPDESEEKIEEMLKQNKIFSENLSDVPGSIYRKEEWRDEYIRFLRNGFSYSAPFRVALDCANGSTGATAESIFCHYAAQLEIIHKNAGGLDINRDCGSTHMQAISDFVKEKRCDVGFAFDGDGDRVLAVDENGEVVDGDMIIAICARDEMRRTNRKNAVVVGTQMSNLGLSEFCKENQMIFLPAPVGDRFVAEEMKKSDAFIGGEPSGHIIFSQKATTGDGQLTALEVLRIMTERNLPLSELKRVMKVFPQVYENISVCQRQKQSFIQNEALQRELRQQQQRFTKEGNLVVRISGTEPVIRIMAQGRDHGRVQSTVKEIAQQIRNTIL